MERRWRMRKAVQARHFFRTRARRCSRGLCRTGDAEGESDGAKRIYVEAGEFWILRCGKLRMTGRWVMLAV